VSNVSSFIRLILPCCCLPLFTDNFLGWETLGEVNPQKTRHLEIVPFLSRFFLFLRYIVNGTYICLMDPWEWSSRDGSDGVKRVKILVSDIYTEACS
jgi:hypothetical protein